MAELADAQASGACVRKDVGVQVPPRPQNFHIDTSAYAAHRLPAALVDYMRGRGRTRVLFGTNWPMLSAEQALARLDDPGLDEEATECYLSGHARRVFNLDGVVASTSA